MSAFRLPRPATAFSLDRSRKSQGGRRQEADHLTFIRTLPCCICLSRRNVEAAHVRYADPCYGKGMTGMGTKPDDRWVTPLCADHHRLAVDSQHNSGEREWWNEKRTNPLSLALALRAISGDEETGESMIRSAHALRKEGHVR